MPGFLGGNKGAAPPPGGGFKNFAIQAAPLFSAMAAGYSSGRGPYAYLDQGIQGIQAAQKAKRDEEAAAAAAAAFGGLVPGGMGTAGMSTMGGGGGGSAAPKDPLAPINIAGDTMAALGKDSGTAGYRASLIGTESGGNWAAANNETGAGGKKGHYGRVQFGHARLQEAMNAGAIPPGTTPEQFMASPALQIAAENWHFADLERELAPYVGTVVNGKPMDMGALVAMGHLGGAGGAKKYVESGGAYNPSDSFGTSLADYASTHGGTGVTMSAKGETAAPTGPADPLADPYVQRLMQVMAMPGLTAEQRGVVELQLQTRMGQLSATAEPVKLQTFTGPDGVVYKFDPIRGTAEPMTGGEGADQDAYTDGAPNGTMWRDPNNRTMGVVPIPGFQAPIDDPLAALKARAAAGGLKEGTPEYQTFMINNGPADGMVIESDGQGGVRVIQGAAAAAAGAKPFTEGQSKDIVYATRAKGALETLDPIASALASRGEVAAGWLPMGLGGGMQSDQYQVAKTAGDEFLQAILRKDTGAAITEGEQALYGKTYLPEPGDSEARLAYKSEARQRAVAALEAGMSPAQIIAQEKALAGGSATPPAAGAGNVTGSGVTWSVEP